LSKTQNVQLDVDDEAFDRGVWSSGGFEAGRRACREDCA
jgi:hypothetical protein